MKTLPKDKLIAFREKERKKSEKRSQKNLGEFDSEDKKC